MAPFAARLSLGLVHGHDGDIQIATRAHTSQATPGAGARPRNNARGKDRADTVDTSIPSPCPRPVVAQRWGSTASRSRDFSRCATWSVSTSLVLVTESAAGSANEDRDMNSYAMEELTRQRYEQFAREAHADRLARAAAPLSRPSVGQSPVRRVGGLIGRLSGAMLVGISRQMRQRRGAKDSPVGNRATNPRRA
jgi:hypothetical protein